MKDPTKTGSRNRKKIKPETKDDTTISRREAIKKAGIYVVFTAAAMTTILTPKTSQAESTQPDEPGQGWGT